MFHIILLDPEIPGNAGNLIRLSANSGAVLHIAGNAGFSLDDKHLRRAGLDYHERACLRCHQTLADAVKAAGNGRQFAADVCGTTRYDSPHYRPGDIFVFGCESSGLPPNTLAQFPSSQRIYIPMRPANRSLNLANAAAIIIMEAWRQQQFIGAQKLPNRKDST